MRRWLSRALVLIILCAAALAAAAWWWTRQPLALASDTVEVSIEAGTSPRGVAQAWVAAGVRTSPWLLYEWFRWSGQARQIRAGSYEIGAGTTPADLLRKMVLGDETLATVKLIEGWTFRQFRAALAKAEALSPTTAAMSDAELMAALGAPGVPPEGRFFPDTYAYSKGTSDVAVLRRALRAMQHRIDELWPLRPADSPLKSADEALVLASIVEKETGREADRGKVAAVFLNRLRIGMPLQTDPSVIYGLGTAFDGNLRKRDLLADGPYNTYTRAGLPPTPIAMPGKASLLAVMRPDPTKALYFVSRGDGSSEFSETLDQHNRAVNRYQRNQNGSK
ncbi:endolytic transglycosylase MltG [Caldimonas sp. KR1-144]|uniref:endolytic transglycosylase MltG n=1 Tax=Caldimonas sp. KR1-144 TaxID=3400911 RepID=UPI003BFE7262